MTAPAGFAKGILIGFGIVCLANSAMGAALKAEDINAAEPSKKTLSDQDVTPAGVRLQVLLHRAHFSPGEIDGKFGDNAKKALRAYKEARHLPGSDDVDDDVCPAFEITAGDQARDILERRQRFALLADQRAQVAPLDF